MLLVSRLNETICWSLQNAREDDTARSLRTAELKPSILSPFDEYDAEWNYKEQDAPGVIRKLCDTRSKMLARRFGGPLAAIDVEAEKKTGRLLLFRPHETLCDGAARESSAGYFDISNIPPWDTWFAYAGITLFCWVPSRMLRFAEAGVSVNPERCLELIDFKTLIDEGLEINWVIGDGRTFNPKRIRDLPDPDSD